MMKADEVEAMLGLYELGWGTKRIAAVCALACHLAPVRSERQWRTRRVDRRARMPIWAGRPTGKCGFDAALTAGRHRCATDSASRGMPWRGAAFQTDEAHRR